MKRFITWIVKACLLAGILFIAVLIAWAFESRGMPALQIWHTASLSAEFTAGNAAREDDLEAYLDREQRLFQQLRDEVYARVEPTADLALSRYRAGVIFDVFNLTNSDYVTDFVSNRIDQSTFLKPTSIANARIYQVGVRLIF